MLHCSNVRSGTDWMDVLVSCKTQAAGMGLRRLTESNSADIVEGEEMTNQGKTKSALAVPEFESAILKSMPPMAEINAILGDYYEALEESLDGASSLEPEPTPCKS